MKRLSDDINFSLMVIHRFQPRFPRILPNLRYNSHVGGTRHPCCCSTTTALTRMRLRLLSAERMSLGNERYAERLIHTLKEEEAPLNDYQYTTEARTRIGHFITQVYHQKRPHSALGYLTPMEFQRKILS